MNNRDPRWGNWADAPEPFAPEAFTKTCTSDVVVVGAGIAGMSCALSAAQSGCSVSLVEKLGHFSCRGLNIGVPNSSLMKKHGISFDPDALAREWIKRCGNRCDEDLVHLFMYRSEEAIDWLLELITRPEYGVTAALQGCAYSGETYKEIYSHIFFKAPEFIPMKTGGLREALEPMMAEIGKAGVEVFYHCPMEQLITENGAVVGAACRNEAGELIAFRARKGVVLATGGIDGNDEMCADLCPVGNRVAAKINGPKGCNTGDGHRAALWAGAAFEDGPFPAMMHPQAIRHASYCFLFVKNDGRRFMNEDNYLQGKSLNIIKTGQKYVWSVFDSDWPTKIPATLPYGGGLYWGEDYQYGKQEFSPDYVQNRINWGLENGYTVMADTPEELAEKMGVDAKGFAETLRRYNEMCAAGKDTEYGKRPELLIPLDKPPYIARKFGPALLAVCGGVQVNTRMEALDAARKPIPGLYCIGNVAGGRYGVDYPMLIPGNSHGTALTFGYLLGRQLGETK